MDDLKVKLLIQAELAGAKEQIAALEAKVAALGGGGQKAAQGVAQAGDAAAKAGSQAAGATNQVGGLAVAFGKLERAVAAYFTVQLATSMVQSADSARVLESRVQNLTQGSGDFAEVWSRIYDISQANGAAVQDTTQLFQRLQVSAQRLGANNQEVLDVVRAVQQLGREGGATAEELRLASVQFGQMLSSPLAQAEELNSILDAMPALARAIEQGLGLMPGGLKAAAAAGLDTSRIFRTLLDQSAAINARAGELAESVGTGMQRLGNATTRLLGSIDESIGLTEKLADALTGVAETLDRISLGYDRVFNRGPGGIDPGLAGEDRFNALVARRIELLAQVKDKTAELTLLNTKRGVFPGYQDDYARAKADLVEMTFKGVGTAGTAAGAAVAAGVDAAKTKLEGLSTSIGTLQDALAKMDAAVSGKKETSKAVNLGDIDKIKKKAEQALAEGNMDGAVAAAKEGADAIARYMDEGGYGTNPIASRAKAFRELGEAAKQAAADAKTPEDAIKKMQGNVIDMYVRPVLDQEAYDAMIKQITDASQVVKVGIQTEIIGTGGFSKIGVDAKGNPFIEGSGEIEWESAKKGMPDPAGAEG
jgi:tape measure domain-containing protein